MYLDNYKIFKTFRDKAEAEALQIFFNQKNIPNEIIENSHELIDTFYTGDQYQAPYQFLIPAALFIEAQDLLKNRAEKNLENLPSDYYLFSFSNKELMEILIKPDEWGELDRVLAEKILRERGEDVSQKKLDALHEVRMATLREPDQESDRWVWKAYVLTFFGGLFGIILGRIFWKSTKTLPNGEEVYRYSESKRTHGKFIYKLGWGFLVFWILVRAAMKLINFMP